MENVLVERMTLERKLHALETYLKNNEKTVVINQCEYAIVDNVVTLTRENTSGELEHFGVDGLVRVMRYYGGEKDGQPYYIGTGTPSEQQALLASLAEQLTEEQLFEMTAANAMRTMAKKRR